MKVQEGLIAAIFFALALPSSAQFINMPTTIQTPRGNVTSSELVYFPTFNYRNGDIDTNLKFDFTIVLSDDSVVNLFSSVGVDDKKMYVIQTVNKSKFKIFPEDTKEISGSSAAWGKVNGIPADSCWLFKIATGVINCYSYFPMKDINTTIAIEDTGRRKIVPLTKQNIANIVGDDDQKIVKWLEEGRLIKVIKYYNRKNQ